MSSANKQSGSDEPHQLDDSQEDSDEEDVFELMRNVQELIDTIGQNISSPSVRMAMRAVEDELNNPFIPDNDGNETVYESFENNTGNSPNQLGNMSLPSGTSTYVTPATPQQSSNRDDDEVIFVGGVIDLCTPVSKPNPRRRAAPQQEDYSDVIVIDDSLSFPMPPQRARLDALASTSIPEVTQRPTAPLSKPSSTNSTSNDSSGEKQPNCAICLCSPFSRKPASTVCGHVFCLDCIMKAFEISQKCPLCNKKLKRSMIHQLFF